MRFLHVTNNRSFDSKVIQPEIPNNIMFGENYHTKRICVAPSISGCLTSIGKNREGDILSVYECFSNDFYQPSENDVPDVLLTGEFWIVEETIFHYLFDIEIIRVIKSNVCGISNNLYEFNVL